MKRLTTLFFALMICLSTWADNFIISNGESLKLYSPRNVGSSSERADQLFEQDYYEVFGQFLVHTNRIEEAKIIASTFDNAELKRYAKLRGINFDKLKGHNEAFILKVHNNGKQLFVVGSDDKGLAFGLMTLSRMWGVSPFRWWCDAPALQIPSFELGIVYDKLFEATIPMRTLILNGAQQHDNYMQDLLLRLRASNVTNAVNATPESNDGVFRWNLNPSIQPYLGLSLALCHPERMRIEAIRAYNNGKNKEWQVFQGHQMGGELQLFLFFDMAWDLSSYITDEYAVDKLEDIHYAQMSGLDNNWSRIWNDFFDLTMMLHPEQPLSLEALRRGIGESQAISLQLSMDMSEKAVPSEHANAYFRTVEYPLNMTTTQMQRLCNMQLVQHADGKAWSVDDCRQRMELLANELPGLVNPKWRQLMGAIQMPSLVLSQSLMRVDDYRVTKLEVGSPDPLPSEQSSAVIYRSKRATGTAVIPYEPLRLPLTYQDDSMHLSFSFLPTRGYGKSMRCLIYIDQQAPKMIQIVPNQDSESQQSFDLTFPVDSSVEKHEIVLRTQSDGIYLQRVIIKDMK